MGASLLLPKLSSSVTDAGKTLSTLGFIVP
jgi:hypothetical protein